MIRKVGATPTAAGADVAVYEDQNTAPTSYECVRDADQWLVAKVIYIDGKERVHPSPRELPAWARDEITAALRRLG